MTHNQFINWANTRSYADVVDIKNIANSRGLLLDDLWFSANGKTVMTAAERSAIIGRQIGRTTAMLEKSVASQQAMLSRTIREMEMKIISKTKELIADGRNLAGMNVNLKQLQAVHRDLVNIFETTYPDAIRTVVSGFDDIGLYIQNNMRELNLSATFTGASKEMVKALKSGTYDNYYRFGTETTERLREAMYSQVLAGGEYAALISQIQGIMTGLVDVRGRPLTNYTNTYAFDSVMNFHNSVNMQLAAEAGLTNFRYSGNIITTSRDFCRKHVGQTYTKEEIESWNDQAWQGKAGPPLMFRGGYNCRHHWVAVDPKWTEGEKPPELPPKPPKKPPKAKPKTKKPAPGPKQVTKKPTVPAPPPYEKGVWTTDYNSQRVWEDTASAPTARNQYKRKFNVASLKTMGFPSKASETTFVNMIGKETSRMLDEFPGLHEFTNRKWNQIKKLEFHNKYDEFKKAIETEYGYENAHGILGVYQKGTSQLHSFARGHNPEIVKAISAGKNRKFVIGEYSFGDNGLDIFRHEYGHHLRQQLLIHPKAGKVGKREWDAIFDKHIRPPGKNLPEGKRLKFPPAFRKISEYACSNSSEAFSECFAAYTHPGYVRGTLAKDIEEFMDTLLLS